MLNSTPGPTAKASKASGVGQALLVDDDRFMLTVMGDLLQELGFGNVTAVTSGEAAVKAYEQATVKPQLVVCDLNMPGGDGFQLMEQLGRKGFAGGVILVSGMDDRTLNSAALMAQFHRLRFLDSLKKPVTRAALQAALAKLH